MDQALKKWQTTHSPEEDIGTRSDYVLRISGKLEFLFEDHPLNQYKVRHIARTDFESSNYNFQGLLLLIWQKYNTLRTVFGAICSLK